MLSILFLLLSCPLLVVATLVYEIYRQARYGRVQTAQGCERAPRVPQSRFLFGVDWLLRFSRLIKERRVLGEHMADHATHGSTFSIDVLGETILHTSDPENVKAVLALDFECFELGRNRYESFSPFLGDGIFNTDGDRWSRARHLIKPNLSKKQIISNLGALETHVQRMFSKIPRDGTTVDLQPLFFRLSMDSATQYLFGYSTCDDELSEEFYQAFERAEAGMTIRVRLGTLKKVFYDREFYKACGTVHKFIDSYIQKSLTRYETRDVEKGDERYVFLHELSKNIKSRKELRDHITNLLVAGRDTTAGVMSIVMLTLARRPDIWAKLQAEVAPLGGIHPTFEQLKDMKYLGQVLKEALRLWPAIPLNTRAAKKDTYLPTGGGPDGTCRIFIPKGQRVGLSVYTMHRRTDLWGLDAHEFRPERWEGLRPQWSYVPFMGGPRICIGQQYALTQMSYVLVRLLQEFEGVDSRDLSPLVENIGLAIASGRGTLVGLSPREY